MIVWDKLKIANTNATNGISIQPADATTLQVSGNMQMNNLQANYMSLPITDGKTLYLSSGGLSVQQNGNRALYATAASVVIGRPGMAAADTGGLQVQNDQGLVTLNVLPPSASPTTNPLSSIFLQVSDSSNNPKLALGYTAGNLHLFKDLSNTTSGYADLFANDVDLTGHIYAVNGNFTYSEIDNLTVKTSLSAPVSYWTRTATVSRLGHDPVKFDVVVMRQSNMVVIDFISQVATTLYGTSYDLLFDAVDLNNCTKVIYKQLSFHDTVGSVDPSASTGTGSIIGIKTQSAPSPTSSPLLTGITIAGDTRSEQIVCGTIHLIPEN